MDAVPSPMEITSAVVNTARVITATDEIDNSNAQLVQEAVDTALGQADPVVVDLTRVTFIGSAGLSILVGATNKAREQGRTLPIVVGDNRSVIRRIQSTGLESVFVLYQSLADVLAGEGQHG